MSDFDLDFDEIIFVEDREGNEKSALKFDGHCCIKGHEDINPKNIPELTVT